MAQSLPDNYPSPPEGLGGEELLEWERICQELDSKGLLDKADRAMITLYCATWSIWWDARKACNQLGSIVNYKNFGPGYNQLYKVFRETFREMMNQIRELGLTPSARHKMKMGTAPEASEAKEF